MRIRAAVLEQFASPLVVQDVELAEPGPGEVLVRKNGHETSLAIGEGFVEVKADGVSVLTDMALEADKIDTAAAEAAVERAKAAMKEDHHTAEEVAAIQASLLKALAQLHVKRRRHHS